MSAPDFATLLDWLDGRLPPERAAEVADQVAMGDRRVQGTVRWLRGFLLTGRALPAYDPPPIVRQRLRQHFAAWVDARAALDRRPDTYMADPIFDSRRDLALAGVRSAAVGDETVHLAYSCEAGDLVVDVTLRPDGSARCAGQVLPARSTRSPAFEVTVDGPDGTVRSVDGDELGGFTLDRIATTATSLRVTNGEVTIVAPIDLRADG